MKYNILNPITKYKINPSYWNDVMMVFSMPFNINKCDIFLFVLKWLIILLHYTIGLFMSRDSLINEERKTTYHWKLFSLLLYAYHQKHTHLFSVCIADTSYYYWSQGVLYCWVIDLLFILKDKNCSRKQKRFVILGNFVTNKIYYILGFYAHSTNSLQWMNQKDVSNILQNRCIK